MTAVPAWVVAAAGCSPWENFGSCSSSFAAAAVVLVAVELEVAWKTLDSRGWDPCSLTHNYWHCCCWHSSLFHS